MANSHYQRTHWCFLSLRFQHGYFCPKSDRFFKAMKLKKPSFKPPSSIHVEKYLSGLFPRIWTVLSPSGETLKGLKSYRDCFQMSSSALDSFPVFTFGFPFANLAFCIRSLSPPNRFLPGWAPCSSSQENQSWPSDCSAEEVCWSTGQLSPCPGKQYASSLRSLPVVAPAQIFAAPKMQSSTRAVCFIGLDRQFSHRPISLPQRARTSPSSHSALKSTIWPVPPWVWESFQVAKYSSPGLATWSAKRGLLLFLSVCCPQPCWI